jgi:hypothetical protein
MKKFIAIFILTLCLLSNFGCGAMKVTPVETGMKKGIEMVEDKDLGKVYLASGFNFEPYDTLFISNPSTSLLSPKEDIDPNEMKIVLKNQLLAKLEALDVFTTVTDDKSVLSSEVISAQQVLVMNSTITELDPGSRALRYLVGFGAGSTKVQVETEIRDPKTKQLYFMASDRRSAAFGVFGGDSKGYILDSLSKIAEAHALFIKRIASGGKIEKPSVKE